MSAKRKRRNRFEDSDDESASPIKTSPKKRRRRNTLQLSQSDEDDSEKKQKAQKTKTKRKSKKTTPKKKINRTPKPLKLTEAKPESKPLSVSPSRHNIGPGALSSQSQSPSSQDSQSSQSTKTKVSKMKKNSPSKSKKKKKNGAKSHDIRNFFANATAADYFSQFDKKINSKNLKTQTSKINDIQNKNGSLTNGHNKDKKDEDDTKTATISLVDDEEDDDVEMEQKEKEATNKPLKRRKKTKTPSPKKKETMTDSPGIGITKNIQNLNIKKDIINISSDSSQGSDDKNTMNNIKHSDSKPLPRSNKNKNKNMNGHHNTTSTQKKAGRKRKLDEISKDSETGKNSTNTTNTTNTPSDPPKKKRKFYPGFKRNDAPPMHGQVDIPTGKPYCLQDKRFVITGQLPSLTRDECKDLIQQYGGRVTGSVSGMTAYLVCGEEAGESKMAKAKEKKVKIIDEAKLLDLIRTLPEKKPKAQKLPKGPSKGPKKSALSNIAAQRGNRNHNGTSNGNMNMNMNNNTGHNGTPLLFVEKYKPRTSADLIGNQSCIKQLKQHLLNWDRIKNSTGKGKNATKKGVLLSGQPGIGKTSCINVIAQELGYTTIEFNASDTRSKKSLRNVIEQSLNNRTMTDFFAVRKDKKDKAALLNPKHSDKKNLIIMDEVDGMSSGDRGGMQELVGYIQKSKIPIICICNDRQHQKVRTLANYCLDLRFRKPTSQQISNRLYRIALNEGFKLDIPTIQKLADGTNGDIRQMLHMLQFWSNESHKNLSYNDVKQRIEKSSKDLTMGPWDVTPKLFRRGTSVIDGINYYFTDYSLIPLMIQENYLNVNKGGGGGYSGYGGYGGYGRNNRSNVKWDCNELQQMLFASQSIADGDMIDAEIRSSQQYSALPYHGVLSSLKPAQYTSKIGNISQRIMFPSWLGKFSNRRKNDRLMSELAANINSSQEIPSCGVTGTVLTMDYMEILKSNIIKPLERGNDAIDDVVQFMKMYNISREDWDTVFLLGEFNKSSGNKGSQFNIATKTKTAFTRKCKAELSVANKDHVKKMKKGAISDLKMKNADEVASEDEGGDDDDDDEDNDITKDSMIKMTKKGKAKGKTKKKATTKKKKTTTKKKKTATKKKPTTKKKRKKKTFDD